MGPDSTSMVAVDLDAYRNRILWGGPQLLVFPFFKIFLARAGQHWIRLGGLGGYYDDSDWISVYVLHRVGYVVQCRYCIAPDRSGIYLLFSPSCYLRRKGKLGVLPQVYRAVYQAGLKSMPEAPRPQFATNNYFQPLTFK